MFSIKSVFVGKRALYLSYCFEVSKFPQGTVSPRGNELVIRCPPDCIVCRGSFSHFLFLWRQHTGAVTVVVFALACHIAVQQLSHCWTRIFLFFKRLCSFKKLNLSYKFSCWNNFTQKTAMEIILLYQKGKRVQSLKFLLAWHKMRQTAASSKILSLYYIICT